MDSSSLTRGTRRFDSADLALAGLVLLGAVLVLVNTHGLSFFSDDWEFIVARRGLTAKALLTPHGPHLSLVPILIYKLLLKVFGGGSYLPFRLLEVVDLALLALTLAWVARRFWGRWWSLVPVALLVTLGPAATSLMWSFQCGYAIATAAGIGALMVAWRGERRSDAIACGLLVLSLASASQGVGAIAGVAVMIVLARDWRRLWVVAIPAVIYLAWYLKYGSAASESHLRLWSTALNYGTQSLATTFAGLTAQTTVNPTTGILDFTFGVPLAVAALAGLGYAGWRGWRPSALFWGVAVTVGVLWFAASISNTSDFYRPPNDPRYLGTNAILVMIAALCVIPVPRVGRGHMIAVAIAVAIVGATNASQYSVQRTAQEGSDLYSRAQLGALLQMRGVVAKDFQPAIGLTPAVLVGVNAENFFSAYDAFGIVLDTPRQIIHSPEPVKEAVDAEMARAELTLGPAPAVAAGTGLACTPLTSGPVTLYAGTTTRYLVRARTAPITVAAGRFGGADSVALGIVPAATRALVSVTGDRDHHDEWRIQASGAGGAICTVA